jgi:hypothetical protein
MNRGARGISKKWHLTLYRKVVAPSTALTTTLDVREKENRVRGCSRPLASGPRTLELPYRATKCDFLCIQQVHPGREATSRTCHMPSSAKPYGSCGARLLARAVSCFLSHSSRDTHAGRHTQTRARAAKETGALLWLAQSTCTCACVSA